MSYRKSVFFARLKQRSPCLSGFCEQGKRASQMLASRMPFAENASRAKTVLTCAIGISGICVKKNSVTYIAIRKLSLWLHVRPKILNYAKQTQFPKCQKCFNLSKYKELQQTMSCELLCKTNPIKPNFSNGRVGSCRIFGVFWRTLDDIEVQQMYPKVLGKLYFC